jgi:hypothetical protein
MTEDNATYPHGSAVKYGKAYCQSSVVDNNTVYTHGGEAKDDTAYHRGSAAKDNAMAIPTMSLMPEEAPRPWQTPWLSSQGWAPLIVGKEEVMVTIAVVMSLHWQQQVRAVDGSKRAGGGSRSGQCWSYHKELIGLIYRTV